MEINSDAQENIDWLNSLYDATEPLAIAQDDVEEYSIKLNDMRSIIEETMETLFTYDGLYNDINQTFLEAKNYCDEITVLHNNINASIIEGDKLTNETRGFILDFQNNVQVRIRRWNGIWIDIDYFCLSFLLFPFYPSFIRSLYKIFIQFRTLYGYVKKRKRKRERVISIININYK